MPNHTYDFELTLSGAGGFRKAFSLGVEAKITEGFGDNGAPVAFVDIIQIGQYDKNNRLIKHNALDQMLWSLPELHEAIVRDWKGK